MPFNFTPPLVERKHDIKKIKRRKELAKPGRNEWVRKMISRNLFSEPENDVYTFFVRL